MKEKETGEKVGTITLFRKMLNIASTRRLKHSR